MQRAKNQPIVIVRGIAGAVVGGVLGWFAFDWLLGQGFYGLALPGALVGFVSGIFSRGVSWINAAVCAILAAILGIVLEWRHRPFVADDSFGYFVAHLHELTGLTWLMIVLGVVFGFWFGRGRPGYASRSARTEGDRDRIE
jgi:hypothetical protein